MKAWKAAEARCPARVAVIFGLSAALGACGTVAQYSRSTAENQLAQRTEAQPFGPALRLARASRANGDLASAVNLYRSVAAILPSDPGVIVELGDTLVDSGSPEEAIEAYRRVDPKSASWLGALLGLQRAYLVLDEIEDALKIADEAVALAPGDHRVLIARGVALDLLARHEEAQHAYRTVLVGMPRNAAARSNLALSLALSRRFDEAIGILAPLSRSTSATPRMRQNLALIYGLAGDTSGAGALSRADLDAETAEANLRFFEYARRERD